jgi:hypothetical protein
VLLPVVLTAGLGTPDLIVPTKQVWAWDYIENYLVALLPPASRAGHIGARVRRRWAPPAMR